MLESAAFLTASAIHSGVVLLDGYQHAKAANAESIIGIALMLGLVFTWIRPQLISQIGLVAQSFALLGTMIGTFMIAIGVGPGTAPDIAYHVIITMTLVAGLIVAARARYTKTSGTACRQRNNGDTTHTA